MNNPYTVFEKQVTLSNKIITYYKVCYNRGDCVAEFDNKKDADEVCRWLNEAFCYGKMSR
jgi:hypothetical protein